MLEMLINPAKAEKRPWEMFFVGAFYAIISLILTKWIFSGDPVLSKYTGILVVTFCVMFSIPFMYFAIKNEEEKDLRIDGFLRLIKEHGKAMTYFMFLFMGFVVAFSFWYIVFEDGNQNFKAQIETYCMINKPTHFDQCVSEYGLKYPSKTTAFLSAQEKIVNIFANNIYVLIFTLVFSLIFGAGAIFILAWNASVISAAIGIFSKSSLANLPLGLTRYMIHGIPEILAYFGGALAGGIISIAVIKHDIKTERFWVILQDSLNLIILSVIILFIAALIEVFITPALF
ncbi:stage II sporulation protein M [Candidatus Pacearchaeota archaeon]|nr:stage II sporulation protein M [Candidatus Pacearchaeota archaeon]